MALKNGSSAIAGVSDVAYLIEAFEEVNSCTLLLSIQSKRERNRADLLLTVKAFTLPTAGAEPVLLASSDMFLSAHGYQQMGPAIMYCLYLVDAQLADQEMKGRHNK